MKEKGDESDDHHDGIMHVCESETKKDQCKQTDSQASAQQYHPLSIVLSLTDSQTGLDDPISALHETPPFFHGQGGGINLRRNDTDKGQQKKDTE